MAGKPQDVHVHGKLSKKVAELTMVVHMLFKRNHEKEVEVQALKGVFEKEINRIQETCNQKIAWLEKQLDTQEDFRVNAEYKLQDLNQLKEKIVELEESNQRQLELINEKDDTARQLSFQVNLLKQKLKRSDERSNELLTPGANSDDGSGHRKSTSLQDDNAEKGLQSENKIKSLEEELADIKHNHLNELKVLTREKLELQRKLENYDSTLTSELDELKKTLDTLSQKQVEDINKLKAAEKTNKDLENKLKKAESDKKSLQSRLQLFQDQLKIALRNKTDGRGRHVVSQGARQRNFDEDDEIERLKREVQWYKLELINRESNFNRMFTAQQPVVVAAEEEEASFLLERNLTGIRRGRRKQQLPQLGGGRPNVLIQSQPRTLHL